MQANPEKFHLIFFNCKVPVLLDGCINKPEKVVKLVGIPIDEKMSFSIHTDEICKQAGRQLSALLFSERSSSTTFNTAQPSGTTVVLQMLDVWKRFRRGL